MSAPDLTESEVKVTSNGDVKPVLLSGVASTGDGMMYNIYKATELNSASEAEFPRTVTKRTGVERVISISRVILESLTQPVSGSSVPPFKSISPVSAVNENV